ncbi:UNVERIFIED_CONTAM: hypothetical protein HDU68_011215 [Siphonaria sp. JEL0065]|nr:hypothetical protein HDU68_011215 [Siphonaria sp. JEL0065]
MTTTEELVKEDQKQIHDFIEAHPDLADDVELEEIEDIEKHIEFIVPQTDDPNTPAFTFRAMFLGTLFAVLIAFANGALSFRTVAVAVPPVVATILSYPMGIFLAKVLPSGFLNPGPFSLKEHVLIYVMCSTSNANGGLPYGIDNVVSQAMPQLMGNSDINFIQALGFVLVTQFLGYGFSGLTRRFLVRPTAMWWPSNLTNIALFTSFHRPQTGEVSGNRYTMSRTSFFWIAFAAMFAYEWLPTMVAPVLGAVSITCLFAGKGNGPSGVLSNYNAVAGSVFNGVGLFGLTFDWNNIYLGGTNFAQPYYANFCNNVGNIFFLWILTPLFYSNDVWGINSILHDPGYQAGLNPLINSAHLFVGNPNGTKKQGSRVKPVYFYNVSDNYNINLTAYNNVAPVHLTSTFALTYASSFLTVTAAIAHVGLWYGKDIYRQSMNAFRQVRDEVDAMDKHVKMMESYPDVPDWAYLAFLAVCCVGGVIVSVATPFNMPWWGVFFNVFIVAIMVVPYGAVQAITGVGLYINVLTEFVIGLMIPGQTVAVMAFKSWGTNSLMQSLQLSQDLKLGQYLHIPPYAMVFCQFWGTFVNAFVSTAAAFFMMFGSNGLLDKEGWTYINYQVFYAAGGIWGAIGPQRFFGIGSLYQELMWCFLIGAICPFLPWLANKFVFKSKYWHLVNFPLFFSFNGVAGVQVLIVMPMLINLISQVILYNKNREFFEKYAYVMGAAFDSSAALVALIYAMMQVGGFTFTTFWALNPNNTPPDYYCYPGATYEDWDCAYYLTMGSNTTADEYTNASSDDEAITPVIVTKRTLGSLNNMAAETLLPLESGIRYDVHLAFGDQDSTTAGSITSSLRKRGISVSPCLESTEEHESDPLRESAVVAFCLSVSSENDPSLKGDIQFALTTEKPIVGVLLDGLDDLGFGWAGMVVGGCSLGTVNFKPPATTMSARRTNRMSTFSPIESLCKTIIEKAREVPGSPLFRTAKEEAELTTADDEFPYVRPTSSLSDNHRKPRLSILRPRSSLYNIAAANKVQLPSPASTSVPESPELLGIAYLAHVLQPSSISSVKQVDIHYSRHHHETRYWLLNDVSKWTIETSSRDDPVLWIHGPSGAGKTVVAATLIRSLPQYSNNVLVSWCLIRRDVYTDAGALINNLVYRLAEIWPVFATTLLDMEPNSVEAAALSTIPQRLRVLLSDPLLLALARIESSLKPTILFVIDALDDMRPIRARKEFIRGLKAELEILPPNIKFLFTSVCSEDLKEDMNVLNPAHIELGGLFQRKDLNKLHRNEIQNVLVPNSVAGKDDLDDAVVTLTAKADGLFLYSRFAFEPMKLDGMKFKAINFAIQTIEAVPRDFSDVILGLLSYLYATANEEETEIFRKVMGALIILPNRISIAGLAGFLDLPILSVRLTLIKVSCFLDFLGEDTVQLTHVCIGDFLLSEACDDPRFRVFQAVTEIEFLLMCFNHLNTTLRANPLNLEDPSTWLNSEIPNLDKCINERIPEHVQYICKNLWVHLDLALDALHGAKVERRVVLAVQDLVGVFVQQKLLEWIEALSLMGQVESLAHLTLKKLSYFISNLPVSTRMSAIVGLFKRNVGASKTTDSAIKVPSFIEPYLPSTSPPVHQTSAIINDAIKLISRFSNPISKASFHIYTTAIPLSPSGSSIFKQYSQMSHRAAFSSQGISRRTPIVIRGINKVWPSMISVLTSHTGSVTAVCISSDGLWIVSASQDKSVRVFEGDTGLLYRVLEGHTAPVWNVSISPDGSRIVSGSTDETVKTWNLSTGECTKTITAKTFSVNSLVISRDGSRLVSINNIENSVVVRESMTGDVVWTLRGHQGPVVSVFLSIDGFVCVSGGADGTIRLWDLKTGLGLRTFEGHSETVNAVSLTQDGKWLVSASNDETVRVWDVGTGRCWHILEGHQGSVQCAVFSADGKRVISGSQDHTIRVWELDYEHPTTSHLSDEVDGQGTPIRAIKVSKNGFVVITAGVDGLIKLWSTESGKLLRTVELFSLDVGSSFQDAVNKLAAVEVFRESDYEYLRFGRKTQMATTSISLDSNSIVLPGGVRVPIDRIEIKRREGASMSLIKVDGKSMMLTNAQLESIEAQIEAVKRGSVLTDSTFTDGQLVDEEFLDEAEEQWSVSEDGWVSDKRIDGVRRFWLPLEYCGVIVSHQDRVVAVASPEGQVLVIHV